MRKLPIPPNTKNDENSIELIRGWIINQKLECSIFPSVWQDEPETWGILIADIARHVASALEKDTGKNKNEILESIKKTIDKEWNSPWEEYEGDFVDWDKNEK